MKTTTVSVRIPVELLEQVKSACTNVSAFFVEAAQAKLRGPVLTFTEKREVLKDGKTLADMLRDAMMERMKAEKDLLTDMPRDEFLKLVAGRLPKEELGDADVEQSVLSLRKSLEQLPGVEDITDELNKAKGKICKLENELKINSEILKKAVGKCEYRDVCETMFKGAVAYAVDLAARNALPGIGDGGGLSDKERADIALEVKKCLEGMSIYGNAAGN